MDFFSLTFEHPEWLWLLLAIPVMVLFSWKPLQSLDPGLRYAALTTRCALILVLVICMAGLEHVRTNKNLTVMFLLDRSRSIPREQYALQEAFIHEAAKKIPPDDRVGVLTFDGQSYVEQLPMRGDVFLDVLPETSMPDRTDMAGGVRMAMALFPEDTAKRIVVISDGNNNVGDILGEVRRASANDVSVDVVPMSYLRNREVYVDKLIAPSLIKEGDLVPLRAVITAQQPVRGTISLTHNGVPIELPEDVKRQSLKAGQNLIGIKVPVHGKDQHRFELIFHPDAGQADTLPENNRATTFTFAGSSDTVLLLSKSLEDDAALVHALGEEKIDIRVLPIEEAGDLDLLGLMNFSCVILSNIGANWFTDEQHKELVTYVKDMGGGLIMTGGDESFGAGGWIGSPVEEIMPVHFEIKHRQVIPQGALVIIMHSTEMPRGNYWGKLVAQKSVDTISTRDFFGLLSFSHMRGVVWDVPLQLATNKTSIKQTIEKVQNGDMPDFATTMDMAVKSLMEVKSAAQRHMIIISDGDASPPSQRTIQKMVDNKITCSTVAIGYGCHVMEPTLRDIANKTGGKFYAARNPKQLPQIFVKESKVIRRPLLVEQAFYPQVYYAMSELWAGFPAAMQVPELDGLVLTSPREDPMVEMPLIRKTDDGDDPVLAHWRVGLGKTVAFTSGYWPRWGKHWTNWGSYSKFWSQVVRWTMSSGRRGNYDVVTRAEGSRGRIIVNALDQESNYLNFQNLTATIAKPEGETESVSLTQVGPGRYEATFELDRTGQYVANVTVVNEQTKLSESVSHAGLSVPYSPEYKELEPNNALLDEVVSLSGGKVWDLARYEDVDIFRHDLKPTRTQQPVWDWVLAWVLLPLFLFDVAVRRLASKVALSIFVEVLLDVILLFGVGIVYLPFWSGFWGMIGTILLGEVVGWSIRWRAIRPTIDFFTHNVVALGHTGQSSAGALSQLKDARETHSGRTYLPRRAED